ncbi:asparagine--tRNA ligase [Acutalibacter muris]|uniref:Asparagine--tRNA ligase n=1 Tax=Acutalibacter muris TaxID=1796620 RepID=A0A1Z2XQL0_9FIRM|nr:asparagine--tRNA ligase [Acutalibacter muris]ANU52642.1 asparagine--tRNA ligase [Hungateiclostridiaceae bacterium KB18]ASB40691.1 asparagine--tRNA ligase [Acutalibacter muris]QQR29968.1 asparagine--tRNA ligase [Acutalibacter muris]
MKHQDISAFYKDLDAYAGKTVTVCGWARSIRDSKTLGFIDMNDGTCFKGVQVVFEDGKIDNFKEIAAQNVGAALIVTGELIVTPEAKQPFEIHAHEIKVEGASTPEYPLQKKRHTVEYLRTIPHLRPRTNLFSAAFRVRSAAAFGMHKFFQENGFVYIHTPVITTTDCEGAEMFQVTTLDQEDLPRNEDGSVDYRQDFFQKKVFLSGSGQLQVECTAQAFSKVYTFGPTFRAERSNTPRHASEFWHIEPEMAFADLSDDMDVIEAAVKYVINYVLDTCPQDMEFCNQFVDKGLLERLRHVAGSDFARVTYTDAIKILEEHNGEFEYKAVWGEDIQTEHERFLAEKHFGRPVFVTDYPKEIKSFYMRQNDDGRTVAATDLLVPGIGELVGASQREERYDVLRARMRELDMSEEDMYWYLDLRRFGTTVHSGFGIGFDRLVMYLTGISNIRDVLPFPRTTGVAEF